MNAHHKPTFKSTSLINSIDYFTSGATRTKVPTKLDSTVKETECKLTKTLSKLPFGWQVDAVLPLTQSKKGKSTLPNELIDIIARELGQFYHVQALNLADLLDISFMNSYIRTGSLIALSVGENEDDVVCIDGRDRMVLSVCKDTYELLGIPGRPSAFGSLNERYVIEIVLNDPKYKAGKGGFERIRSSLRNWPVETSIITDLSNPSSSTSSPGKKFEMLFAFRDSDGKPSTIMFPNSIPATSHLPTFTQSSMIPRSATPFVRLTAPFNMHSRRKRLNPSGQPLPRLTAEGTAEYESWYDNLVDTREWIGTVLLGMEGSTRHGEVDEGEAVEGEMVWRGSWNGFFHPTSLGSSLINGLSLEDSPNQFLSLSIHPPPCSPLAHLAIKQTPATRKRPNGANKKRGRGQGDDEEGSIDEFESNEGGIEFILGWDGEVDGVKEGWKSEDMGDLIRWVCWAGQQ